MKGPTLQERWKRFTFQKPAVSKDGGLWWTACDLNHDGDNWPWANCFPTHAEALAAANAHAATHKEDR